MSISRPSRPCPYCGRQLRIMSEPNGGGIVYIRTYCPWSKNGCGYLGEKLPVTAAALELAQRKAPVEEIMAAL